MAAEPRYQDVEDDRGVIEDTKSGERQRKWEGGAPGIPSTTDERSLRIHRWPEIERFASLLCFFLS